MNHDRKTAVIVGILILAAYSILGTNNHNTKMLSMFLELISGLAVISIAVLMFPYLKPYGKTLSLWYLGLKYIEGTITIIAGALFFIHSQALLALRDQLYLVHAYIFAVPALLFYYLLYQSRLIPRWLSVWGVVASLLLLVVNVLELMNAISKMEILYLPIVLNEVVLALWLITKGFKVNTKVP